MNPSSSRAVYIESFLTTSGGGIRCESFASFGQSRTIYRSRKMGTSELGTVKAWQSFCVTLPLEKKKRVRESHNKRTSSIVPLSIKSEIIYILMENNN